MLRKFWKTLHVLKSDEKIPEFSIKSYLSRPEFSVLIKSKNLNTKNKTMRQTYQSLLVATAAVVLQQSHVEGVTLRTSSKAETTSQTLLNTMVQDYVDDGIHTCDFAHRRMADSTQPNYEQIV